MDEKPRVTIVIPAYNAAKYLAETLESALRQTLRSFEIVVVDDGSTDDTAAVARRFPVALLQQKNSGAGAARNRGISEARGKYIALLDSDDIWEPNYLETMIGFLKDNPQITVAFPDCIYFGESKYAGLRFQEVYPPRTPITFAKVAARVSHVYNGATIRRSLFDGIRYDETLKAAEDFDLWLRVLKAGHTIEAVPAVLVHYRRHQTALSLGSFAQDEAILKICEKWLGRSDLTDSERVEIKSLHKFTSKYLNRWQVRAVRRGLAIAPTMTRAALRWYL